MNIVDIIIILLLICGAVYGFKKGAVKRGTTFISLVVAIVCAAIFKEPLAKIFYKFLPFFDFGGELKGAYVLNILLYQIIAFFLVLGTLMVVVRLVSFIGNTIESVLKATVVLEVPSKILGIVVGALEMYVYIFIVIYVLSLPMLGLSFMKESKMTDFMLNNTPILSNSIGRTIDVFDELYKLNGEYNSIEEYNNKTLQVVVKYNITDKETIKELIQNGKLKNCNLSSIE